MHDREGEPTNLDSKSILDPQQLRIRLGSIPVHVSVSLCHQRMRVADMIGMTRGTFIPFRTSCDSPLEVRVDKTTIAFGQAVRRDIRMGVQLDQFVNHSSQ